MKTFLKSFITMALLCYSIGLVYYLDFNPINWSNRSRICLYVFFLVILLIEYWVIWFAEKTNADEEYRKELENKLKNEL